MTNEKQAFKFLFVACLAAVTYLSLLPGSQLPKQSFFNQDKLVHIIFYALTTWLFLKGFLASANLKNLVLAGCFVFFYSFMIEILQHYISVGRFFDKFDILANGIGVVLSALVYKKLN